MVRRDDLPALLFCVLGGQVPPVMVHDGQRDLTVNHLQGIVDAFPHHRAAQDRRPVHHTLPGQTEGPGIGHPRQPRTHLIEVGTSLGVHQAVEQHPGLQRRQRVDVLHVTPVTHQAVDACLVEAGEREVRRGAATRTRAGAVRHDLPQGLDRPGGQAAHRGLVVHRARVGPGELQLPALDHADDLQQAGAGALQREVPSDVVTPGAVQPFLGARVPLAVVVERDLRQRVLA